MNPAMQARIAQLAASIASIAHGGKGAVLEKAAEELHMSRATLMRHLKSFRLGKHRRRRADAGQHALSRDEALVISAYLTESARRNGKRLASIEQAVEVLRANGAILAGRVDDDTGEFFPLSPSAISRSLRTYALHPDQLMQPAPKIGMASRHPNHIWQDDPSLCVLYYLRQQKGLRVMDADTFYKNKPKNLDRIASERVWRYVFTDHASGALYVEYVQGGETSANHLHCLINAMQSRGTDDPFHGVPLGLVVDPGSANTSHEVQNLCRALSIDLIVTKPGQPWAKGQVEKSNDLVERYFEHGLKFVEVSSLDELNAYAHRWMRYFNAKYKHSRTGRTRYEVWQTISQEQLRVAPSVDVCRSVAMSAPEVRVVTPQLTVQYRGKMYDVSHVPGVMVGEKLDIARNAWRDWDTAHALVHAEDGHLQYVVIDALQMDAFGFREDAQVWGEGYSRHADTRTDTNRKAVEQVITGTESVQAAEAKRKAKALPFDGKIDPYKPITDTPLPSFLPKRGTALEVPGVSTMERPLNHVEAARLLKDRLGALWTPERFTWLQARFPEGVPADQVDALVADLGNGTAAPDRVPVLTVVRGGVA